MENNEEYSDSRHTFGHEDIEELEEKDEDAGWPRPGRDLRAHLYKYILGLIVLVTLVLGAVLYLLHPFGRGEQGITTERLAPVQTVPESRVSPMDTEEPDARDQPDTVASRTVPGEPSSKYISMQDEERGKQAVPDTGEAEPMARPDAPAEAEMAVIEPEEPSDAAALPSSAAETGSETTRSIEATAPSEEPAPTPKPAPAPAAKDREKPVLEAKTQVRPSAPDKKPASPTTLSKAEITPQPAIPRMPVWYVQVGAFQEESNAIGLKARLVDAGFPTLVAYAQRGNRTLYVTRVGPYSSRVKAEIGADELRKKGHQAVILKLKE